MRNHHAFVRISLATALVAGLFAAGSSAVASPGAKAAAFTATGSAKQVYVTGVAGGARLALINRSGDRVATKRADSLGGAVFYKVSPGSGYRVRVLPDGPTSGRLTVHSERPAPWDPKVYDQSIPDHGYGYLTTRDGTKLAYYVHPPTAPAGEPIPDNNLPTGLPDYAPPYPTLIEYSGYGYANPAGPTNGIAVLANLMGFAVVDVNMRGSGCSGGAYNFFEPLQNLDGYDVIETIARQPWVKGHKVGMMGISYGGISQLFTAQLRPPSLAAISPLSVIDATATTLYPGGIRNDGFAVAWAKERQAEAQPAGQGRKGTQPYAEQRIRDGDKTCKSNQVLHGEAQDLLKTIRQNSHYRPAVADPLDPVTFVHKIDVPVFMACQWEDEQTGGHCPTLAAHMTGTKTKWFTFTNGPHIDSLDPETYNRWYDFLELYVAKQAPAVNAAVTHAAAPAIYQAAMGLPQDDAVTMPLDPIQAEPTYESALAAYEKLPSVRILFDNGAGTSPSGDSTPGNPYPAFEQSFPSWPIPHTAAHRWYLGPQGTLTDSRPTRRSVDWYTSDAKALPLTDFGKDTGGGGLWGNASQWEWNWKPNPAGTAVSYVSAPLKRDTAVIGAGAVYVWVKSSTPDVDLQATISEVTPDGKETFVQNGYLRASERKLSTTRHNVMHTPSTLLEPVPSILASDARPMPAGRFVKVAIPLYYQGHVYRAGTRIRVTIAAPNGAQPIWSFSHTRPAGTAKVSIAISPTMPSSLVLPVVPGVAVPTGQPPCPSLRNEPCRPYTPLVNRSSNP
ncbi:MAG TPA: CocE/NonD family hydrolase [Mycobacteriales bacterium]|nr:CocE/NonD family hydrolase [Mycobacteriales bacterium]